MPLSSLKARKSKPKRTAARPKSKKISPLVLTIGHSTRPIDEFIGLLRAHDVTCVVDVRTVPRSRHNPQFNRDTLPKSLKQAGVGYVHLPELGGLRHSTAASLNTGWRNRSFRGFADYMQGQEFESGLAKVLELADRERPALMCAEVLPWRCHRSLIGDALLARKVRVEHIMSATNRRPHKLTAFAKIKGTHVTYPGPNNPVEVQTPGVTKRHSKIK